MKVNVMTGSRILLGVVVTWMLAACASVPPASRPGSDAKGPYRTRIVIDSSPIDNTGLARARRADSSALGMPVLTMSQLSEDGKPVKRIQLLDAADKDLPVVLRELAETFGMNYQIDPDVHGSVRTHLQNVTLEQALDELVLPQGYTYIVENGVLRVSGARVQTRIFTLDYVALSRTATTNTSVQRRIGGGAGGAGGVGGVGGFGGGGGGGGGSDQISSTSVLDLWAEISGALSTLVFDFTGERPTRDSTGKVIPNPAQTTVTQPLVSGGLGGNGAQGFNRITADRRLIINPIAGTILVTAPPAKLAEVATFIQAFEGSIQRQVLIEAKIVEVRLNKDFQFGIDWTQLARISKVDFGATAGTTTGAATSSPVGTINLRLGGGSSKINLVLRALQGQGAVSVLSSPRVATMNNIRATFNVTTDEVFFSVTSTPIVGPVGGTVGTTTSVTPSTVSVGIVLDVLPQISADNTITMNIRPHVTSVIRLAEFKLPDGGVISVPVIDTRDADTIVRARAGETVVIGGLMQNSVTRSRTSVPGLGSLPLVGGLFRGISNNDTKSELVIFITPTIVVGQPAPGPGF